VSGDATAGNAKPRKGDEYLKFAKGALQSSCAITPQYNRKMFMAHHALQMAAFQDKAPPAATVDLTIDTPTYLLARDEDCENSFHSTADFMNMLVVSLVMGVDVALQQVMLFDKFADGPYIDLVRRAFSPSHAVLRHSHYAGKR
jgi:hypothetical protein